MLKYHLHMPHILLQLLHNQLKLNINIELVLIVSQFFFNIRTIDSQKQLIHFQIEKGRFW